MDRKELRARLVALRRECAALAAAEKDIEALLTGAPEAELSPFHLLEAHADLHALGSALTGVHNRERIRRDDAAVAAEMREKDRIRAEARAQAGRDAEAIKAEARARLAAPAEGPGRKRKQVSEAAPPAGPSRR